MNTTSTTKPIICPKCGREYTGKPSLSRADNATLLCPDCGTQEALDSLGVSADEKRQIADIIRRHRERTGGADD